MSDIDAQARALYERNTNGSAPPWENLGDVTKGVWREQIQQQQTKLDLDSINTTPDNFWDPTP